MLTHRIQPPHERCSVADMNLMRKWAAVLESNIGGVLEPHVEAIVSHCLEEQVRLNKGYIFTSNHVYEEVQQYALPLIRRVFGNLTPECVERLREYDHDASRTRMRSVERYDIIPKILKKDHVKRLEIIHRAEKMQELGYSDEEIQDFLDANRTHGQIIAERTMLGVEHQMRMYLERSIMNGTFVSGALMDTNIVSSKYFDCYIG